jgi:hypothetical protein
MMELLPRQYLQFQHHTMQLILQLVLWTSTTMFLVHTLWLQFQLVLLARHLPWL